MEGKANFSIKNVDNQDKETYDMNYQIQDCGNLETLKEVKKKIDGMLVTEYGAIVATRLENKPEATE